MEFLTIEQLAERLKTGDESTSSVVREIRQWKAAHSDFPYYQGKNRGKLRFVFSEVVEWLRRGSVADSNPSQGFTSSPDKRTA
jgi:hypothetical protein